MNKTPPTDNEASLPEGSVSPTKRSATNRFYKSPSPIKPFDPFKSTFPEAPPEFKKLIGLLADVNYSLVDVDAQMGWAPGKVRSMLKRWPILAQTAGEARVLAMRAAGLEKSSAYVAYKNALEAEKTVSVEFSDSEHGGRVNVTEPDHKVRITAADRILTLFGERVISPTTEVNVDKRQVTINVDGIVKQAREAVMKAEASRVEGEVVDAEVTA